MTLRRLTDDPTKPRIGAMLRKAREVGVGIAVSPAPDNKLHWIIVVGASK